MYLNMYRWQYYPIEIPCNQNGEGPCDIKDAHYLNYEVWDRHCNSQSAHNTLAEAIDAAVDLNLKNDTNFMLPLIKYPLDLIEGAFGSTINPIVTRDDEKAMSIKEIASSYAVSSDSVKRTILALTKYATIVNSVMNSETAVAEIELANMRIERDHYSKLLTSEINASNALSNELDAAKREVESLRMQLNAVANERDDLKISKDLENELAVVLSEFPLAKDRMGARKTFHKDSQSDVNLNDLIGDVNQTTPKLRAETPDVPFKKPLDDDLGFMESKIKASMQEEFLTGAQLAMSPQLTKARCRYLNSILDAIGRSTASVQYESVCNHIEQITTRYINFCNMDYLGDFDEKLATRNHLLTEIEASVFSLKEVVDNLSDIGSNNFLGNDEDVFADYSDFSSKRNETYIAGGLPAHLRDHWDGIKKLIE